MSRLNAKSFFDEGLTNDAHLRALQELYNSEINWSIECFWDRGFTVKLGDEQNGFESEDLYRTLTEAIRWLADEAIKYYPNSGFAKDWKDYKPEFTNKCEDGEKIPEGGCFGCGEGNLCE